MAETNERNAVFPIEAGDTDSISAALKRIKSDPRALGYAAAKRRVLRIFAPLVDYRAASFIKQEMLARGGDAFVGRGVIDASVETSSVLMLGTPSQMSRLVQKMGTMDCWGLKSLRESLGEVLKNICVNSWDIPLPGGRTLTLDSDTRLMGILNVTPDSFHAPSRIDSESDLLKRAEKMLEDGASVLDIGAESTRPGSVRISAEEEQSRLLPALRALRRSFPEAVISVDTYRGSTALAAAENGADIINDVSGFEADDEMLTCAVKTGLPYVLSHIKGGLDDIASPAPSDDILSELNVYFRSKLARLKDAGMDERMVIIDPGLGFGKTRNEDLVILKEIGSLRAIGRPILVGHSMKRLTGKNPAATTAVSAMIEGRAELLRVHDTAENMCAVMMARAVRKSDTWGTAV